MTEQPGPIDDRPPAPELMITGDLLSRAKGATVPLLEP
jgi:hypothetical protein